MECRMRREGGGKEGQGEGGLWKEGLWKEGREEWLKESCGKERQVDLSL